jgi:hypothetical protein
MTNFDPTTNRIPFGLLTPEEQKALMTWPHGWEYYVYYGQTEPMSNPANYPKLASRGKPAPKKITYYCHVYKSVISIAFNTREECKEGEMCGSLGILQIDIINNTPTFTFIPKDKTK